MSEIIEFKQVCFSYKNQKVFENLNHSIPGNQFLGVIGVNGSGKSTLLKLALGLLKANQGDVVTFGQPAGSFQNKKQVGSSLQDIAFPSSEKVDEVLRFVSKQYDHPLDLEELIENFQLSEFRSKSCGALSGGMKRRLSLACALVGRPKLILLDEPTNGLDVRSRKQLMKNLKAYQLDNHALILMISHHPEEATQHVSQFLHVHNSQVSMVSPETMKRFTGYRKIRFQSQAQDFPENIRMHRRGDQVEVITTNSDQFIRDLCASEPNFKNLEILKLDADEIFKEMI